MIAVGPAQHIAQIPQVLEQLQRDNTAAVDKIVRWQAELAALEGKKEAGWEQKADEIKEMIRRTRAPCSARAKRSETRRPSRRTPAIRR